MNPNHSFVFSPEYLTEKNFINDFLEQSRIVLGFPDVKNVVRDAMRTCELFQDFTQKQTEPALIHNTTACEAEMAKYTANCFLATKVAFFNEIYDICKNSVHQIKFDEVVKIACLDERIADSHNKVPGPDGRRGFGGACFPKDLNALIYFAEECGLDPMILQSVWTKNLMTREDHDWESLAQVTGDYKKDEI
jgi:UDPglucose 6-dehydrogenase